MKCYHWKADFFPVFYIFYGPKIARFNVALRVRVGQVSK